MENVVLTVHLILALLLIGIVLLQRSEGGGLGIGGSGGNVMSGRQAANALTRGTWIIASAFLVTSIALTVIAARNSVGGSVVDRISPAAPSAPAGNLPNLPTYAPPPGVGQPVLPPGSAPAATEPAATEPAETITEAPAADGPVAPPAPAEPAADASESTGQDAPVTPPAN
ncbi:preprotein translocase subunit SecG [Paracoccus alkenifer]|uniref:Protein-export membrane protein SecG n=1 Tax=Paracoccus alkenifer TaxID=65735 RepID=A0A1H6LJX2_9RHOB|nr:preprotein translocase subunit SecG [Paracoccus alkenifer]SEH84921.1 preprotein translocase subunit SecG [Paracoccus alkenifer]